MRIEYAAGLVAHLLTRHEDVAKVETFAEAGLVGPDWPPCGIVVTMRDRSMICLSSARTSASGEDLQAQPATFDPEVLNASSVRG